MYRRSRLGLRRLGRVSVHDAGGIADRGAGVHRDRNTQRFGNFFSRRAKINRGFGVGGDY